MALVLKTNRKPQWVEVLEDVNKPKGKKNPVLGRFKVLPLTPDEIHSLLKECKEDEWLLPPNEKKKKNPQYIRESTIGDPTEFFVKKAEKVIVDWEDIFTEDENGNKVPVEFSKDMIETFYRFNPDVIVYVVDKSDEFSNLISKAEDGELKN